MFLLNKPIHPALDRYLDPWMPPDQTWASLVTNPDYLLAFRYFLLNGLLFFTAWLWGLAFIAVLLKYYLRETKIDTTLYKISFATLTFLSCATGLALIIALLFFLALFHYLDEAHVRLIFGLTSLVALCGTIVCRKFICSICQVFNVTYILPVALFIILLIILQFSVAASPVVADATSFHVPYADYFLKHHGLAVDEYMMYPYHAFNINLLFSLALMLDHELSYVQSVSGLLVTLTMLGIYAFCRESGQRLFIALLLPLIFRLNYSVEYGAVSGNVDVGGVFFVFSSIFALWLWQKNSSSIFLILSAISLGLAVGSKYILLIFCLPVTLSLLYFSRPHFWRHFVIYLACGVCFGSWWYIRNAIYTGNPLHPFASGVFGYFLWDERDMMIQMSVFNDRSIPRSFTGLLLAPWYAYQNQVLHFQDSFIVIAMLFISTAFAKWIGKGMNMLLCFAWIYLISWIWGSQDPRHLLPLFPAVLVYSGFVISKSYDLIIQRVTSPPIQRYALNIVGAIAVFAVLIYAALPIRAKFIQIYYSNLVPGETQDQMLRANPQLEFIHHVNETFAEKETFYEMGFGLRWFMKGNVVGNPFGPHSYWRLMDAAAHDNGRGMSPVKLEKLLRERYGARGVIIASGFMPGSTEEFDQRLNLRYRNTEGSIYTWKDTP
jgi:hypothetical protein